MWRTHQPKTASSSALQFGEIICSTRYRDLVFRHQTSTKGCLRDMSFYLRLASVLKTKQHDKTKSRKALFLLVRCLRGALLLFGFCTQSSFSQDVSIAPLLWVDHTSQMERTGMELNDCTGAWWAVNKQGFDCGRTFECWVSRCKSSVLSACAVRAAGSNQLLKEHPRWSLSVWQGLGLLWELLGRAETVVASAEARMVTFIWGSLTGTEWPDFSDNVFRALTRWHCECKVLIL